jgi:probable O-glycosylation ligase (exosortase A-associated)
VRDLGLFAVILALLPLAAARPFVGVLLWCWVSFMNPHRLGWGFASELPLATMAFGITLVGCLVAREPRRLPVNAVTVLLVAFLACITVSSFAALAPPPVVWRMWEFVLKIILGLLLTAALLTDRWRIHALVWLMVISLGYFGVRGGVFTLITGGGYIVFGPPETMITDRNALAVGLLVTLPLMNYLRMASPYKVVRWGLVAAMVLTLFAVVGSQSRGALLGLAATALVFWLRSSAKLVSGIAIAVAVAGAVAFMPASWTERMHTIETYQEDQSAMGRLKIWKAAFALAVERPLVGAGFRAVYQQDIVDRVATDTMARADHSIWFEVLGEHGFIGFAVWLGILLAGVFYSFRIVSLARDRPDLHWARDLARMAQVSIVAYAAGGSFLSLGYWDLFWTILVIVAATHAVVAQAVGQERPLRRAAPAVARPSPAAAYP